MRLSLRQIAIALGLVGAGVMALVLWPPGDPDARALNSERTARLLAYHQGVPLPGAAADAEPLDARLLRLGFKRGAPIFVRIYKRSFELELWVARGTTFALFQTYPICTFSGGLGPKLRTGDRQSPEGVYRVTARQLNPNSRWHKAFNLGFPNVHDLQHGRTGSFLMVHGGCSSVGCYAMTNPAVDDIYTLASAALAAGQAAFQVQALPFRMTADAIETRQNGPNVAFWRDLKAVSDVFDATHVPPDVAVCDGRYVAVTGAGRGHGATSDLRCRKL